MFFSSKFYFRHRGLIINLASITIFFLIQQSDAIRQPKGFAEEIGLGILFLAIFFLEPWATYYSMGAMNQRRIERGLEPSFLHRNFKGLFLTGLFFGGRLAILGVLYMSALLGILGENLLDLPVVAVIVVVVMMVREGFIVYFMTTKDPLPNFKEQYDFLADLILLAVLAFAEIVLNELFRDMGLKDLDGWGDFAYHLLPMALLFFVFYLPIRYIYTVEDLTFAETRMDRIERVVSFFLVFFSFIIIR